jgi:hypothetical protein
MIRLFGFALALVIAAIAGYVPAERPAVQTVVLPDPGNKPRYYCWEPHIAADPEHPERVVVSAMYRGTIGAGEKARGDCLLAVWRSADAGRTWSAPATPFVTDGRPAGRLGADPVLVFGPGGTCWFTGCDYDWKVPGTPNYSSVKVTRSDDGGKTWGKPLTVAELDNDRSGKGIVDKPWVAVDHGGGKRNNTVYVAWSRLDEDKKQWELRCAALPPGGKAFADGVTLGEPTESKHSPDAVHQVQLVVRTDGTLDAVWRTAGASRIVHASSRDGGATFSKPEPISADDNRGVGQFPSLVGTADGRLLAAWGHQGQVFLAVQSSGQWSAVQALAGEVPDGDQLSHPAVAATADALWVLAFRREKAPGRVRVVLYRSTDHGAKWEEYSTLAGRELTGGKRAISPGDYIGLTAARNQVYAAYVLPGEERDGPSPRLHVSSLATPTKH